MSSKAARNLIITLIILIIGIVILTRLGKNFTSRLQTTEAVKGLLASIDSISNVLILGLGIIVIVLIPVYMSKRSGEKKIKPPEVQKAKK